MVTRLRRTDDVKLALPPDEYMRLVCGNTSNFRQEFERVGRRVARGLESVRMLEPGARLLDIGCGCGRVAVTCSTRRSPPTPASTATRE
jgi:cyclopropane fatty-acyl-phospholipid synthase-like methyltransferase